MKDKPVYPVFNYNGVGSNKIIDFHGSIFILDRLTNEYERVKK